MSLTFLTSNETFFSKQNISNFTRELQAKENLRWVAGLTQIQLPLIYFGFVIILLASLFGNSVVIHVIRTENSMKTTINYLILNQAFADILITLLKFISVFHYSLYCELWFGGMGGMITCKLFKASFFILPTFSIWILVTIAVERYFAVVRPLQSSPISQHFKENIVLLWAWSIISSTGLFVNVNLEKINESYFCDLMVALPHWTQFNISSGIFNVLLPLLILAVLYTIICIKLWSREVPGDGTNQNQRQANAIQAAKKVTRMMLAIVFLFLVCWFPFLISIALQMFGYVVNYRVHLFPIWLTVAYSGINPYVYLTFNVNFRSALKRLLWRVFIVLPFRSQSLELQQM